MCGLRRQDPSREQRGGYERKAFDGEYLSLNSIMLPISLFLGC
jgi:hypothetical protein